MEEFSEKSDRKFFGNFQRSWIGDFPGIFREVGSEIFRKFSEISETSSNRKVGDFSGIFGKVGSEIFQEFPELSETSSNSKIGDPLISLATDTFSVKFRSRSSSTRGSPRGCSQRDLFSRIIRTALCRFSRFSRTSA